MEGLPFEDSASGQKNLPPPLFNQRVIVGNRSKSFSHRRDARGSTKEQSRAPSQLRMLLNERSFVKDPIKPKLSPSS